jgi:hypothetical protein
MDPFDNDDAGDWSWTLEDGAGPEAVRDALAAAVAPSPDESTAAPAVAAAALVAAARGMPVVLPDTMQEWLAAQATGSVGVLSPVAVAALDSVLGASELADTWDEQGPAWREQVAAMRDGLAGPGA